MWGDTKQYLKWRDLVDAIPNDIEKSKSKHNDDDNDISFLMNKVKIYFKISQPKKHMNISQTERL